MLDDGAFTSQDLRDQLYSTLRRTGTVDSLKSQLRNRLVQELKKFGVNGNQENATATDKEGSLFLTAANSLIADHLRKCQYDYSFSVFLPECGLSEQKMFGPRDLLRLLKVSQNSTFYKNMSNYEGTSQDKGFLWQFLSEVAGLHGSPSYDMGVQTDQIGLPPVRSIDEKLRSVDEYYADSDQSSQLASIEERMMLYRKAVDQQAQSEIKMQVTRIKDAELSRIRSDEKEKFWDKLNAAKSDIERDYRVKYNALIERERNSMEQIQKQQRDTERENYMQRQNLLSEIEAVRQREVDLRRQQESFERDRKMAEDLNKKKDESVRRREEFMRRAETEYDHKLQVEIARFKAEAHSGYLDRHKDLEFREIKAKEDGRRLEDELRSIQSVKDELREKRLRVQQLESEVESSRKDLRAAQQQTEILSEKNKETSDYEDLKEENLRLRQELRQVRTQLTQVSRNLDLERRRHEDLLREMEEDRNYRPNPEMVFLQKELERVRSQLRQEKVTSEQLKLQFDNSSYQQRGQAKDMVSMFETQTFQQEEMVHEIDVLRQQLAHSRQILKDQVYKSPTSPNSPGAHYFTENMPESEDATLLSHTEDYSYSGLLSDSKSRLQRLDQEAESLEENYRNFQFRMTNVEASLPPVPQFSPSRHFNSGSQFASPTPGIPVRVTADRPQRANIPETYTADISRFSNLQRSPLRFSSAPAFSREQQDFLASEPESGPVSTSAPSASHELDKASVAEDIPIVPEHRELPTEAKSRDEPVFESRRFDDNKYEEDLDRQPVELERERAELEKKDSESERMPVVLRDTSPPERAYSPAEEPKEETKPQEPAIDPVMQKYMEMIKQKRETAPPAQEVNIESEKDISEILDKSKSNDDASDAIFDDW